MRRRGKLTEALVMPAFERGMTVREAATHFRVTTSAIRHWEKTLGIRFRAAAGTAAR
jgi:transposase